MQYRSFGRSDWRTSALGFGCMRLPTTGDGAIDEPAATAMLHETIAQGVNYFDTAWPYHGGESERLLGRALQGEYRDRARIATKLPSWAVHEPADFDRFLNEQLARLQRERVDYYLLHNLRKDYWDNLYQLGVLDWFEKVMADGRVGGVGFSFHSSYDVLREVIDVYDHWCICQIQYNYVDEFYNAGTRGLRYAASKELAVVVMEPLLGGRLVAPPAVVQRIWDRAPRKRTPVEWALQWLWDKPEVAVALSGMSAMEQLRENLVYADRAAIGSLTDEERALVAEARDAYLAVCPTRCTGCKYCEPCPNGVAIAILMKAINQGVMGDDLVGARRHYAHMAEGERASACVACRACEDRCPQRIPISEWMQFIHQILGEGRPYDPAGRPQA